MPTRSIARGLRSDNPAVITRALRRFVRLLGTDTETGERRPTWQQHRDAFAEEEVDGHLMRHADSADNATRELAMDGLAVWQGEIALAKLLARSMDEVVEVRASAIGGLEGWPDSVEALDTLVAAADEGEWSVRWRAARALARFTDSEAVEALFGALLDPDSNVRCAAGDALSHHDPTTIVPRLRGYFDYPSAHMLDSALELMGEIGSLDDAKFLTKVGAWTNLSQPAQVRSWARSASKRIRERHRSQA